MTEVSSRHRGQKEYNHSRIRKRYGLTNYKTFNMSRIQCMFEKDEKWRKKHLDMIRSLVFSYAENRFNFYPVYFVELFTLYKQEYWFIGF